MGELSKFHQSKLLGIVERMTSDGVAENDIRAIVDDYKRRYSATPAVQRPAVKQSPKLPSVKGLFESAPQKPDLTMGLFDWAKPQTPTQSPALTLPTSDSVLKNVDKRLKDSAQVPKAQRDAETRKQKVSKLPFTESELKKSSERGWSIVKTKTGGQLSIGNALRRWSQATGESGYSGGDPYALDNPKLYYTNFGELPDPEQAMQRFGGRPFVPSVVENPEKRQPLLSNVPSKVIGGIVKNEAKKYKNLNKQEVQNLVEGETSTPLVKASDEVFNLAKYFVPGVNTAAGIEDAGMIKSRANEVGWKQAGTEFAQGFAQSFNVFDPNISAVERTGRIINGLMGTLAISAGAGKAIKTANLKMATNEIARKFDISQAQAHDLIKGTLDVADLPPIPIAAEDFLGQSKVRGYGTSGALGKPDGALPSPPSGANPGMAGTRLLPDPLPFTGTPKAPSQILRDVQRLLNRVVYKGTPGARGALGTYEPGNGTRTTIRYANDIDTAAHEIAHALDDQFNIVGDYSKARQKSPFDKELGQFWVHTSRKSYSLKQKRAEGVAEFVRAYVVAPDQAKAMAPQFYEHFKLKVGKEVLDALDAFSKDVREYAGATNAERVKANIQFNKPPQPKGLQAVKEFFKPEGQGYQTPSVSKVKRIFTDDLDPLVKAVEEARRRQGQFVPGIFSGKYRPMAPDKDPILFARMHAYFKNKFDNILQHGIVNERNERVGKPLRHILEPLDSTNATSLETDLQDMLAYMVAQRTIEKGVQTGNTRVANFGAGLYDNLEVAQEAIKELISDPVKAARIQESAKRYREWAEGILQYAVDKGRISPKEFKRIKASNDYYVAMQRVVDDLNPQIAGIKRPANALGRKAEPIKKFQGSTREIENPLQSLMEQAYAVIKESDRNDVLVKFTDLLTNRRGMYDRSNPNSYAATRQMNAGNPIDFASIGHKVPMSQKGEGIIIYRNGKKEKWVFEQELMNSLKDVGKIIDFDNFFVNALEVLPRVLRNAVTSMPGFVIRNKIRDFQDRLIKARTGNKPVDSFRKITPEELDNYSLYGGGVQTGKLLDDKYNFDKIQAKLIKEIVNDKNRSVLLYPGKLLEGYKRWAETGERKGRLSEVRSALREAERLGYDEYQAQLYAHGQSRDLLDFARGGTLMKVLNRFIPFSNANVQGLARTGTGFLENPGKMATKMAVYSTMPTLLNYYWNKAQGEEIFQEYLQLPMYLRRTFYNIKIGDKWLRIPKPFEIGAISEAIEAAVDTANQKRGDDFDRKKEEFFDLLQAFIPVNQDILTGGPLQTAAELSANFDYFRDKNIVPHYEQDRVLSQRKTDKASRLGKAGQAITGVDARKIEHVLESQLSGYGKLAEDISDIGRTDIVDQSNAKWLNHATGLFVDEPAMNARDVQWVLKKAAGVGIPAAQSVLADELEMYRNAKTSEQKRYAAKRLRVVATRARNRAAEVLKAINEDDKRYPARIKSLLGK